ncbi:MAG: hypothetical protein ACYDA8_04290, partial [Deferrisomatales bacterium]
MGRLETEAYEGLAFGAEFCHRRLPDRDAVLGAAARCRARGLGFSLVTPVLREAAFDAVAGWLEALAPEHGGGGWVGNDWGLLEWAPDPG